MKKYGKLDLQNCDCMEMMAGMKDDEFDLAIVDPMYDLSESQLCPGAKITKRGVSRKHRKQAKVLSKLAIVNNNYYDELKRVSKVQIIWGINYFSFSNEVHGRIIWDKKNDESTFSNCEIASLSSYESVRIFRYMWNGFIQERKTSQDKRIHAFQKPVALYNWLLDNYAKEGDKILDTHGGSMSIAIACYYKGFDLACCELDKDYYKLAVERVERETRQMELL